MRKEATLSYREKPTTLSKEEISTRSGNLQTSQNSCNQHFEAIPRRVPKQELAFRGHVESSKSLNKGNYFELLNLIAEYDERFANNLSTATTFARTSNKIQNGLINSVADVMLDEIGRAISNTPFVAKLLDETTDISNKSQLSTMLRYVTKSGKIEERFLDVSERPRGSLSLL
ncbi:hypothetical protein ANN_19269 [Periplaneta americana]|uniref:DUF4371 domain-containing protein n=1 Tax=Periplaneta americana TaxID=6978 RepID=A0ABQ8S9E5_PERAM|nr:hypothetical protein ANN_19269 [Periplaneta americana]